MLRTTIQPSLLLLAAAFLVLLLISSDNNHGGGAAVSAAFTTTAPFGVDTKAAAASTVTLTMTTEDDVSPSTFREAEVLGLKLMQEQKYEEALKGRNIIGLLAGWLQNLSTLEE